MNNARFSFLCTQHQRPLRYEPDDKYEWFILLHGTATEGGGEYLEGGTFELHFGHCWCPGDASWDVDANFVGECREHWRAIVILN